MAMFERLFVKRNLDHIHDTQRSYQIKPEQIRLLLFKECDWRGRKILFDSSTIERVPAGKNDKQVRQTEEVPCIVEVSQGFSYVYKGPAADASILGEMIFGAVAMNYKGVSLKIHIMEEPRRLMCTKVFCVPMTKSRGDRKTVSSGDLRNGSKPLNVPTVKEEGMSLSFSLDRGDSGFYGEQSSPYSSVGSTHDYFSMFDICDGNNSNEDFFFHSPPGRKLSTSSNGSWQRRTFQNAATRFELGNQSGNLLSVPTASTNPSSTDSQIYSNSSTSGTSDSLASGTSACLVPKKNKLGLALLITVNEGAEMDLVTRCVEHSPQMQALICRLRLAALSAGSHSSGFISTLYNAACDVAKWLSNLMCGPYLPSMWLSLVTSDAKKANKMADSLLADMCSVLAVGDTKNTNFFISTLLTHVLTFHLGWVTSVSPYDTLEAPAVDSNSKRPYNALWAQLSDLCGSIGFPPRAAKTIITGTSNTQFVHKLLIFLTYFIRSGDVSKTDIVYEGSHIKETKVINVSTKTLKRSTADLKDCSKDNLKVINTQKSDTSVSTLISGEGNLKKSSTLALLSQKLSTSSGSIRDGNNNGSSGDRTQLKRTPTMLLPLKSSSNSSLNSSNSEEMEVEKKVVFVLGDDEKLVGLKNKSISGKSVKKSSKNYNEPVSLEVPKVQEETARKQEENIDQRSRESPSKCCGQTLQHSKPIKHSGFKFEFDKYPQIVTNYMKSKNLEILDRHYIGKPGNLKLDNFQFDPTVVPPIQEERCEICYKCQQIESMLQTPTNASEMEYMNDIPRQTEPQYATETIVEEPQTHREVSPKTFIRIRKENTVVVNVKNCDNDLVQTKEIGPSLGSSLIYSKDIKNPKELDADKKGTLSSADVSKPSISVEVTKPESRTRVKETERLVPVRKVIEFPMPGLRVLPKNPRELSGFDKSLLGGVTDHYVPDLVLQGTTSKTNTWEMELCRDIDLASILNKTMESPIQALAIIGDTNVWEVRVVGRDCGTSGMSSLVGAMLDALPAMWRAKVPANQCLLFLEGKLREFCILSKTLADLLMSTDFCDIATLTKSLNIDVNDVPLLLAIATTHTPQVATRYGISYR